MGVHDEFGPPAQRDLDLAFAKHRTAVKALARRELQGSLEALVDEVVLEVLEIARRKLAEHDGARFRPWLFGLTVGVCRSLRQKRRDIVSADGELYDQASPEPSAYAGLRSEEREDVLQEAAQRVLEPVDQEIVYMRYTLELPNAEIARVVGFTDADAVRVRLIRTRNRLRRSVDEVLAELRQGRWLTE